MKKTKIYVGFAIFAAFLMLMTTCVAGPVQEGNNLDASENVKSDALSSVEAMSSEIKNDQELRDLLEQIANDQTLNSIVSRIENADNTDVKNSLTSNYVDVLVNEQELSDLQSYLENSYTAVLDLVPEMFGGGEPTGILLNLIKLILDMIKDIILEIARIIDEMANGIVYLINEIINEIVYEIVDLINFLLKDIVYVIAYISLLVVETVIFAFINAYLAIFLMLEKILEWLRGI